MWDKYKYLVGGKSTVIEKGTLGRRKGKDISYTDENRTQAGI